MRIIQKNNWMIEKEPVMVIKSDKAGEIIAKSLMFEGKTFISHIRYASVGKHTKENTHLFKRELFEEKKIQISFSQRKL